jgi:putative transcriptional regulator
MENITKLNIENGYYIFKLKDILYKKKISINKLMRETNTDFKVIKRLMTGELVKIDIFVLARLCDYLDCSINDIIEYKH